MRQVIGSHDLGSMHPEDLSPRETSATPAAGPTRRARNNSRLIRNHMRMHIAAAASSPTKDPASPGFGGFASATPDSPPASALMAAAAMGGAVSMQPKRFRVGPAGGAASASAMPGLAQLHGAAGATSMIRTRARRRRSSIRSALDVAKLHKQAADMAAAR